MIKKMIFLGAFVSFCSLNCMNTRPNRDDSEKAVALGNQFDAILSDSCSNSEKLGRLRKIKNDLIKFHVTDSSLLDQIIESLGEKKRSPFAPEDHYKNYVSEKGLDEDGLLLNQQEQEYQKTLLRDMEKKNAEQKRQVETKAAKRLQALLRGKRERRRYRHMLNEKQEDQDETKKEFALMSPLDERIVSLAKKENPDSAFNDLAEGLDRIALHHFRRSGLNIAKVLKESNKQVYSSEHDRQTGLYSAIVSLFDGDKQLAQRRAQRIVQRFLGCEKFLVDTNKSDKIILNSEKKKNVVVEPQPTTTTTTTTTTSRALPTPPLVPARHQPIFQVPNQLGQQSVTTQTVPTVVVQQPQVHRSWREWFNDHRSGILTSLSAAVIAGITIVKLLKR